eukprot:746970-Hanusia_phi.AAC.3
MLPPDEKESLGENGQEESAIDQEVHIRVYSVQPHRSRLTPSAASPPFVPSPLPDRLRTPSFFHPPLSRPDSLACLKLDTARRSTFEHKCALLSLSQLPPSSFVAPHLSYGSRHQGGDQRRSCSTKEGHPSIMERLRRFARHEVYEPAVKMSMAELGMSLSAGGWGGLFPIPGATTIAVFALLICLRTRFTVSPVVSALAVAINLLLTPVQIMLIPVFMLPFPQCSPSSFLSNLNEVPLFTLVAEFGQCLAGSVLVWAAAAPLAMPVLFSLATAGMRTMRWLSRRKTESAGMK